MSDDLPRDELSSQAFTADRSRGILTKGDRELLLNEKDYDNEQQVRDARYRLRTHMKAALLDAHLLSSSYSLDEYAAVLRSADRELGNEAMLASMILAGSLQRMAMQFLWAGLEHGGFEEKTSGDWDTEAELAHMIQRSIRSAAQYPGDDDRVTEVEVDINITRGEIDESNIVQSLLHGTGHPQDLLELLEHGDAGKIKEQLEEMNAQLTVGEGENKQHLGPELTDEDGRPLSVSDEEEEDGDEEGAQ
jgi:hypothetical protein